VYAATKNRANDHAALAAKVGWQASELEVAPGVRLQGLVRRPRSEGARWLLFYPGNDEAQLKTGQAFLERVAGANDMGLAIYAYRGFDGSDGAARLEDLRVDALSIWAGLQKQQQVPAARVGVIGFSIGGLFAIEAVAAAARAKEPAGSLSLLASVDDVVMVRASALQRFDPGERYQTLPLLGGVPAPVLIVQGTADEAFKGPGPGRAIAKALGDRARYVEVEGGGHGALLQDERAIAALRDFLPH
jgi:pimeloyl-ACP methyl ester carboxylesterase